MVGWSVKAGRGASTVGPRAASCFVKAPVVSVNGNSTLLLLFHLHVLVDH